MFDPGEHQGKGLTREFIVIHTDATARQANARQLTGNQLAERESEFHSKNKPRNSGPSVDIQLSPECDGSKSYIFLRGRQTFQLLRRNRTVPLSSEPCVEKEWPHQSRLCLTVGCAIGEGPS